MVARITVRLPESLHNRLVAYSRAAGVSLNQLIVDSLEREVSETTALPVDERERLRAALGDLVAPSRETILEEPDDAEVPILSHEELQRRLPRLSPSLSETIIANREDRF